ncbi:hypothetical protein DX903_12685, partial [Adlercreutzia equolifaciens]
MGEHQITSGEVVVETTDGDKVYPIGKEQPQTRSRMRLYAAEADQTGEGSIVINLGGQIAVKKVTLRITGTSNQGYLAEISKVEFVNDMEKRIPDTQWDTPENLQAESGDKSFTLTWNACVNVTGYEVEITYDGKTQNIREAGNELQVKNFMNNKLVNNQVYH